MDRGIGFLAKFQNTEKLIKILDYEGEETKDETYENISHVAATKGNLELVKDIQNHGFDFGWNYVYFLQSSRSDGDRLALKYGNLYTNPDVASTIGFIFGNREIMLKYIALYPKNIVPAVLGSFRILSDDEIIKLLAKECISKREYADLKWELKNDARDYLLSRIRKDIAICKDM